jgi:hypothetical protein
MSWHQKLPSDILQNLIARLPFEFVAKHPAKCSSMEVLAEQ